METIEVVLRELSESVDDAGREASEVSELNLLLNEKRMRMHGVFLPFMQVTQHRSKNNFPHEGKFQFGVWIDV